MCTIGHNSDKSHSIEPRVQKRIKLTLDPGSFVEKLKLGVVKVTLLSTPVSSELPFCKTTLLRKQLSFPILFGRPKIGKKDVVPHCLWQSKDMQIALFPLRLALQIIFQKF